MRGGAVGGDDDWLDALVDADGAAARAGEHDGARVRAYVGDASALDMGVARAWPLAFDAGFACVVCTLVRERLDAGGDDAALRARARRTAELVLALGERCARDSTQCHPMNEEFFEALDALRTRLRQLSTLMPEVPRLAALADAAGGDDDDEGGGGGAAALAF